MSKFRTSRRIVEGSDVSYTAEAARVQERAARRAPSVIRLGRSSFFPRRQEMRGCSTSTVVRPLAWRAMACPRISESTQGAASDRLSSITGAVFNAESAEFKAMLRARRGLRVYGLKTRAKRALTAAEIARDTLAAFRS
jgi:hypothetical protein